MSAPLHLVEGVTARVDALLAENARLHGENDELMDRVAVLENALRALHDQARSSIRNAPVGEDFACAALTMQMVMAEKGLAT